MSNDLVPAPTAPAPMPHAISEAHLRLLIESVQDYAIVMLDPEGRVASWNKGAQRIKGYTEQEILGRHFSVFYTPEDVAAGRPDRDLHAALESGRHETECPRVRRDGVRYWANVCITPLRDAHGRLEGFGKISRDITERKRSEDRFRLAVEAAPNAMLMINRDGLITLVNSQTEKLFGYPRAELLGQTIECLVPARYRGMHPGQRGGFFAKPVARSMGVGRDLNGLTKEGREVPIEIGLNPIETGEGVMVLASIIDITERKRAEDRFRLTVEAAPNAMLMVSPEGRITLVNSQTEKLFGYPREALLGQAIEMLVPERYRAAHPGHRGGFFSKPAARSMGIGRDLYGLTRDGREVPIEIGLNPIETGEGMFVLASIIDITERKRAEGRFRLVVEAAPNAMLMVSPDGRITLVNAQTEKLFGYPRELLLGQAIEMLVPERYRAAHPGHRGGFFSKPVSRAMGVGRDLYGLTKDAREVPIEIGLNPIETADGVFVLASIIDITERKRGEQQLLSANQSLEAQVSETHAAMSRLRQTQDQLIQSEKLASLGGLVAGVAHEINTPVGVGVTAASHLRGEVQAFAEAMSSGAVARSRFNQFVEVCKQSSDIILTNLNRAAELIQSFKQVAVDQSSDGWREVNLLHYLQEIMLSLRPRLKKFGHQVELDCAAELQVYTVPGALSQIITNLVMNTLTHAFDEGSVGTIRIAGQIVQGRLVLRYSDSGNGIPEEIQSKIFDPFFTTKRGQGGSGLGLHIVYNLVHSTLGGRLTVSSKPRAGTTFILDVPLNSAPARAAPSIAP